MRKGKKIFSKL